MRREAHEGDLPPHTVLSTGLLLAVFCGGMVGAVARVWLAQHVEPGVWPWPTLVANLAGSFVLGIVATRRWPPFFGPGFCGALTTFSTLQVELIRLGEHGHAGAAIAYGAVSLAGGLLLVTLGTSVARWA